MEGKRGVECWPPFDLLILGGEECIANKYYDICDTVLFTAIKSWNIHAEHIVVLTNPLIIVLC